MLQRSAQNIAQPFELPPAPQPEIVVQFITVADAFAQLAPHWTRLHDEAATASVVTSWIWQYQWWQVYGAAQPLRILVALEHGQTLGILALYIQTIRVLGLRVRLLRFVGSGADTPPADLGPVLAPEREEAVARALAQAAFHVSDADVVLLTDIDPRSPLPRALEQAAAAARREPLTEISERIAYIDLPRSWSEFLASLRSNRRTHLKSARRKVALGHRVRFF